MEKFLILYFLLYLVGCGNEAAMNDVTIREYRNIYDVNGMLEHSTVHVYKVKCNRKTLFATEESIFYYTEDGLTIKKEYLLEHNKEKQLISIEKSSDQLKEITQFEEGDTSYYTRNEYSPTNLLLRSIRKIPKDSIYTELISNYNFSGELQREIKYNYLTGFCSVSIFTCNENQADINKLLPKEIKYDTLEVICEQMEQHGDTLITKCYINKIQDHTIKKVVQDGTLIECYYDQNGILSEIQKQYKEGRYENKLCQHPRINLVNRIDYLNGKKVKELDIWPNHSILWPWEYDQYGNVLKEEIQSTITSH